MNEDNIHYFFFGYEKKVNRIWSVAGIEWKLFSIDEVASMSQGREDVQNYLLNSKRDEDGKSDSQRIDILLPILPIKQRDRNVINIYLVPYLGETSQGKTLPHKKIIIAGEWSDKFSHATLPPEKCLLVEKEPMQKGSFSRTIAHELGHIVGLQHPQQNDVSLNRLMGGRKQGYNLTSEEIAIARQKAMTLFKN